MVSVRATAALFLMWGTPCGAVSYQDPVPASPIYGDAHQDKYGRAIAELGDLDGDGRPEVGVGAPESDLAGSESGAVLVQSGTELGIRLGRVDGASGDFFGSSLASVGDIDGDGVPDFVVGAPGHDGAGGLDQGRVDLIDGASLSVLGSYSLDEAGIELGAAMAAVGDRDGDGTIDVLVGAPRAQALVSEGGAAVLLSVTAGGFTLLHRFDGDVPYEGLGRSMVGVPDTNSDGDDELAIGSPDHDGLGFANGRVQVFSGDASTSYARLLSIDGSSDFENLGGAMDVIEDPDGSGAPCLVITWRGRTNGASQAFAGGGGIYRATDGALVRQYEGTAFGQFLGITAVTVEDLDGDGHRDVLLGSPLDSSLGPINHGTVHALSSDGDGTPGGSMHRLYRIDGSVARNRMGSALAAFADLNGDGCEDFVVGADQQDDGSGNETGAVHALLSRVPRCEPQQLQYQDGDTATVYGTSYAGRPSLFCFMLRLQSTGRSMPVHGFAWLSSWSPADADGRLSHSIPLNSTGAVPYEINACTVVDDPLAARGGRLLISTPRRILVN